MEDATSKFLKPKSYYSRLYDEATVERCRWYEKNCIYEYTPKKNPDKKSKYKPLTVRANLSNFFIPFYKGERYIEKEKTIRQWMNRDEERDQKIEKAVPPQNIFCPRCDSVMQPTMKDSRWGRNNEEERVFFFFECPKCQKRQAVFENGEELKFGPTLCEKCKSPVETKKRKGNKLVVVDTCKKCGHEEIWDFDEKPEIIKEKPDQDFEKDRARFCLSESEGQEYIRTKNHLERATELIKQYREGKAPEQLLTKINKLSIVSGLTFP